MKKLSFIATVRKISILSQFHAIDLTYFQMESLSFAYKYIEILMKIQPAVYNIPLENLAFLRQIS